MHDIISQKRLSTIGYGLNTLISIVLPLFSLVILHFYPYRSAVFLTNLFGFTILGAMSVSIVSRHHGLYVLNLFSGVLFLNVFIKSTFPASFIHIDFVIYALLTIFLWLLEIKHPHALQTCRSATER